MFRLFAWMHRGPMGRQLNDKQAVDRHRNAALKLVDMMFEKGPLLGLTRIVHDFEDYHVTSRQPVGSWRITIERVEAPPEGKVERFERRR